MHTEFWLARGHFYFSGTLCTITDCPAATPAGTACEQFWCREKAFDELRLVQHVWPLLGTLPNSKLGYDRMAGIALVGWRRSHSLCFQKDRFLDCTRDAFDVDLAARLADFFANTFGPPRRSSYCRALRNLVVSPDTTATMFDNWTFRRPLASPA